MESKEQSSSFEQRFKGQVAKYILMEKKVARLAREARSLERRLTLLTQGGQEPPGLADLITRLCLL